VFSLLKGKNDLQEKYKNKENKFLHIEKKDNGDFRITSQNLSPVEEFKMIEEVIENIGERIKDELRIIHANSIKDLFEYDKKVRSCDKSSE